MIVNNKLKQRKFKVFNLCPFDLMRWGKDQVYESLDYSYLEQFQVAIEILEAKINFIKDGLQIEILSFRKK